MNQFLVLVVALAIAFPARAVELGPDGLHKPDWLRVTSKDLVRDFARSRREGKLLLILVEQRGCIYCEEMHENVFTDDRVKTLLEHRFFPIQFNLHGDGIIVDTDGERLSERNASRKWGAYSTPTIMLLSPELKEVMPISDQTIAVMRGAFPVEITLMLFTDLLSWVDEKGHLEQSEEDFPAYHRRRIEERERAHTN
ncbi:thioredoxin family protein [Silicimonas sp. MF1-12-2]|uniref:thioredoxin family protein n=1 Tax=Silicimonas sp. MF1-12-2 TaxID=3384793 RepID=UPI0039B585DF